MKSASSKNRPKTNLTNVIPFVSKQYNQFKEQNKLLVKDNNAIHIINIDDITMIKAEGNYSTIYSRGGSKLLVSKTLMHFDRKLCKLDQFVRTHKSYLVNTDFIQSIVVSNEIKLAGVDELLPLARSRRTAILTLMERMCLC